MRTNEEGFFFIENSYIPADNSRPHTCPCCLPWTNADNDGTSQTYVKQDPMKDFPFRGQFFSADKCTLSHPPRTIADKRGQNADNCPHTFVEP